LDNFILENKLDILRLGDYCLTDNPQKIIKNIDYDKKNNYWFLDNSSDILAVGHFDTVEQRKPNFEIIYDKIDKTKIRSIKSIQLDDRLGLYIIGEILPQFNCNYDILITDFEEVGNSSAFNFKTDKQYNWIFEFDRHGINPVLYQYEKNRTWYKAVLSLYDIAVGSFSDICALDWLGCCAINFGTGYYLEHTKKCFCDITDLNTCINKFLIFYNKNKNIYYNFECEKGYKNSAKQELNNGI